MIIILNDNDDDDVDSDGDDKMYFVQKISVVFIKQIESTYTHRHVGW